MKSAAAVVALLLCSSLTICQGSQYERYRCVPSVREPCENGQQPTTEVLAIKSADGPYEFGPYACKFSEQVSTYLHYYVYEGRNCYHYWHYYRYLYTCRWYECVKTDECYCYTTLDSYYDCCPGFIIDSRFNETSRDSDEYQRELRRQGCHPPARQNFVRTCLDVLALTELTNIINSTEPITSPVIELTLFAPSNEILIKEQDSNDLDPSFLLSHIVLQEYHAAKFVNGLKLDGVVPDTHIHITTVTNQTTNQQRVFASGAEIVQKDACFANNGAVHIINGIISTDSRSAATIVEETDSLEVFYNLLRISGIIDYLEYEQLRTVFAPTDTAFRQLIESTQLDVVACLLHPNNIQTLEDYLVYHIAVGAEYSATLALRDTVTTKLCRRISCSGSECVHEGCLELMLVTRDEGIVVIGDEDGGSESAIDIANVPASNGVIHHISLPLISPRIDFEELCAAFPFSG